MISRPSAAVLSWPWPCSRRRPARGADKKEAEVRLARAVQLYQACLPAEEVRHFAARHLPRTRGKAGPGQGGRILAASPRSPTGSPERRRRGGAQALALDGLIALARQHTRPVASVAFSADGEWLATSSWDNTVRLWRLGGKDLPEATRLEASPSAVAFHPDGRLLATGSSGTASCCGTCPARRRRKHALYGHQQRPFALAFSPTANSSPPAAATRFYACGNSTKPRSRSCGLRYQRGARPWRSRRWPSATTGRARPRGATSPRRGSCLGRRRGLPGRLRATRGAGAVVAASPTEAVVAFAG